MQKFSSKKDWWVVAFVICLSGLLIQLLLTMQSRGTLITYPLHTATYVFTVVIMWWTLFNTRYVIENNQLFIRCLFIKWQIPLADIQRVSKTNNSMASPALSLDRLKIEYSKNGQNKVVLVSPKYKQEFCDAIQHTLT